MAKFGPQSQNFQFRLKFGTYNSGHNILELDSASVQIGFIYLISLLALYL